MRRGARCQRRDRRDERRAPAAISAAVITLLRTTEPPKLVDLLALPPDSAHHSESKPMI